jgi:hypothetical protein
LCHGDKILASLINSFGYIWDGMEGTRKAYTILVGKPEGKRALGRPRRRWVDNIKMDLRDRMGLYGLDLTGSG